MLSFWNIFLHLFQMHAAPQRLPGHGGATVPSEVSEEVSATVLQKDPEEQSFWEEAGGCQQSHQQSQFLATGNKSEAFNKYSLKCGLSSELGLLCGLGVAILFVVGFRINKMFYSGKVLCLYTVATCQNCH